MLDPTATCLNGISADVLHRLIMKLPFPNYSQSVVNKQRLGVPIFQDPIPTASIPTAGRSSARRSTFSTARRHAARAALVCKDIWPQRHVTMQVVIGSPIVKRFDLVYCSLMIYVCEPMIYHWDSDFLHVMPLPWWDKTLAWCKNQVVPQPWRVVPLEEITNQYICIYIYMYICRCHPNPFPQVVIG